MRHTDIIRQRNRVFRRITGVKKKTYELMVGIVQEAISRPRKGRRHKLSAEEMVLLFLQYTREYVTYLSVGVTFGISESAAYVTHTKVEKILIGSKKFCVPGKNWLLATRQGTLIITDATESIVERPKTSVKQKKPVKNRKNKQKRFYSGKKKKHTLKSQIVVDQSTKKIIAVKCCNGKRHDFRLFKESDIHLHPDNTALFDTGYTGIKKLHANSLLPKRATKKKPLTKQEKKENSAISSIRVLVENAISSIKRFKILSTRYRNRRRRFALRLNLIAGIYNFELT